MSETETPATTDAVLFETKELLKVETDRQIAVARFSPCGRFLFTGCFDSFIRRWNFEAEEPAELPAIGGHRGWVQCLAFHPDTAQERLFTTDTWGAIAAWKYTDEKPEPLWKVPEAHDGWIRSLVVSADGKKLATTGRDQIVRVWSTEDGKQLHEFTGHEHDVYSVGIHPDGNSVVSGDLMGHLKHWNLTTNKLEREKHLEKMHYYDRDQDVTGLRILEFTDDGKTLVCGGSEPNKAGRSYGVPSINLFDWETLDAKESLHQGEDKHGYVYDLWRHADGYFVSVTSGTPGAGQLLFHRPGDDEPFYINTKMSNCHTLAPHPDGKRIVVTATNRNSQGNGAVRDKEGHYLGNSSPIHFFEIVEKMA